MSKEKTYYKVSSVNEKGAHEKSVKITKFDSDLNVLSSYYMNFMDSKNGGYYDCQCPASRFDCRHKGILKAIQDQKKVNSEDFFCFETRSFHQAENL